jgi:hypothetical protein
VPTVKTVMVEAIMTVKAAAVHPTTATTMAVGQRWTAGSHRRPCH